MFLVVYAIVPGMTGNSPTSPVTNPEDIRIGATIREMRIMRGMNQDGLATAAVISRAYLANIEAGRKRPSMKVVARLASALVVPQISIIAASDEVAA